MAPSFALIPDGDQRVIAVLVAGQAAGAYLGPDGMTNDLSQATDLRGPIGPAVVSNLGTTSAPNAGLTIDPSTGDLYQTSGS